MVYSDSISFRKDGGRWATRRSDSHPGESSLSIATTARALQPRPGQESEVEREGRERSATLQRQHWIGITDGGRGKGSVSREVRCAD